MADGELHHARACQHPRLVGRIDDAVIIDDDIIHAHRVGVAQIDMAVAAGLEDPEQTERKIRFLAQLRATGPVAPDQPLSAPPLISAPNAVPFPAPTLDLAL